MPLPEGLAAQVALVKFGEETHPQETTPSATTTMSRLVPNMPDRVELIVINAGTDMVTIRPTNTVTSGVGIRLPPGVTADILADEDGDMVGYKWFMVAASGTQQLYVLEVS